MRFESILLLALASVLACEDADGGGDAGGGDAGGGDAGGGDASGDPSPAAVEACHVACDDQLFYDCIDADVHETCWNACPERSESDIELFAACVLNSGGACDPGCLENFLDADPVDPTGTPDTTAGGGPGTTSGGSTGVSCVDACEEFLGRGCTIDVGGFDSCTDFCDSLDPTLHDFVVMCVEQADGCTLPADCTFPDGG